MYIFCLIFVTVVNTCLKEEAKSLEEDQMQKDLMREGVQRVKKYTTATKTLPNLQHRALLDTRKHSGKQNPEDNLVIWF